jgi:chromosome segregation ATPase
VEDQFNLAAAEEQVSALNTRVEQLQKDVATREAALSQEVKSRKECEKRSQELQASAMYFDQLRNVAETHLVQERTSRRQAESLRESQLAQFGEYLSLTDRERKRLEHVLLEEESSLRLDLKTKCHDLELMQAQCTKLKVERDSERDRLNAELTSSQKRLEVAFVEHRGLCNQLHSRTQEVKEARHDCAVMKSHLSAERDTFDKDRSSLRAQTDHALSALRESEAGSLEARKRAEAECATLNLTAKEQSKALMVMQAGLVSERERLTEEFSISRCRLETQLEDSRKQIETLRGEHETSVQGFQTQRANFEYEVRCAAEAIASTQAAVAQKEAELQTERAERERCAVQLSSVRTIRLHVEEQLVVAQQELARVEEKSAKERTSFIDEREQLVSKRASAQEQLSSLQTKLSEVEDHRQQLQASLQEQQSDIASKHSTMQNRLEDLEGQLLDTEQRRTQLEDLFLDERAALEKQLRNIQLELDEERAKGTNTTAELSDERQRTQDLSSSRATLEQELASCRSQLTLIEEKGKCAEAEQADLRLQCGAMSAKLETAQGECERLRTDLSSERLRFGAERSMSPDSLRGKVASLEAYLDQERAVVRTLREEQAKDLSSHYWSDLSSQLLRSLHEAQDRLRAEESIRQVLEDKLAERARVAIAKALYADSMKAPGLSDPV